MTQRRAIEQRLERLGEIAEVMDAMKTLALLETRKLARRLEFQDRLVAGIELAGADFLAFHPEFRASPEQAGKRSELWVLMGSERGFCGDFNEQIVAAQPGPPAPDRAILALGRRLASRLDQRHGAVTRLDGPNVAEEVLPVMDQLTVELQQAQNRLGGQAHLKVLAHDLNGIVTASTILPMVPPEGPPSAYPPRLNIPPPHFYSDLSEQYLLAKLPQLFYGSLMAENRRRMEHMDGALRRLDAKLRELRHRKQALRQEEIIEEIEIILLSER